MATVTHVVTDGSDGAGQVSLELVWFHSILRGARGSAGTSGDGVYLPTARQISHLVAGHSVSTMVASELPAVPREGHWCVPGARAWEEGHQGVGAGSGR